MGLLIAGVLLWALAHMFKRVTPEMRDALTEKVGEGRAKMAVAGALFLSIALMIIGFINAPFIPVYEPPVWFIYVTDVLMFPVFALLGMGSSGGTCRSWFRHPMLMGSSLWGIAHLLSNGDLASVILFGGIGVWGILQALLINARSGPWERPEPGTRGGDLKLVGITILIYSFFAGVHMLIGPSPFPG